MFITIIKVIQFIFLLFSSRKDLKIAMNYDKQKNYVARDEKVKNQVFTWTRAVVALTNSTVSVTGLENIPHDTAVVFMGNHQGYMDIPLILGYVNKPTAFISKIEIKKVPIMSKWMELMQCVFMDRKNMRQSVQAISDAVETLKNGYSLVIFPEGTRSKGGPVAPFKAGSFKLAFRSEVPIIPLTIDGTWKVLEEHKKLCPSHIKLTIHPPIQTKELTREEQIALPNKIRDIVISAL